MQRIADDAAFAARWGDLGPVYGKQWVDWPTYRYRPDGLYEKGEGIDQVSQVIESLRTNPGSRRHIIEGWNVAQLDRMALPPCHKTYQFHVGANGTQLNCLLYQRSCDVALGLPYNIAGYAFLLELISRFTGIKPGYFGHTLIDAHIYTAKTDGSMAEYDHIPGLREQLVREPRALPRLEISPEVQHLDDISALLEADTPALLQTFRLHDYDPHPALTFKVAV